MDNSRRVHDTVDELTASVVFLYAGARPDAPIGSAFVVGYPARTGGKVVPLLVTAKHVIESQSAVRVHLNGIGQNCGGESDSLDKIYSLDLARKNGGVWIHPDPAVDIAIFRVDISGGMRWIPISWLVSRKDAQSGKVRALDRVVIPSLLPALQTLHHDYPIVREGSIALFPPDGLSTRLAQGFAKRDEVILVNAMTSPGTSGAPVFLRSGQEDRTRRLGSSSTLRLVGLVKGFYPAPPREVVATDNTGSRVPILGATGQVSLRFEEHSNVGVVTPSWLITDVLENPSLKEELGKVADQK